MKIKHIVFYKSVFAQEEEKYLHSFFYVSLLMELLVFDQGVPNVL